MAPRLKRSSSWKNRATLIAWAMLAVLGGMGLPRPLVAADPVLFRSGAGRFEVAAIDSSAASAVNTLAEEAWRLLSAPLGLPEGFSAPVVVRVFSAAEWTDRAPFRVFVEPGGLVSIRLRWDGPSDVLMARRALVQGLLMRLGVAQHGVKATLSAPLWLEYACLGWWHSRLDGANLDALKQETAAIRPPGMGELIGWQRGGPEPRERAIASVWLLSFFLAESTAAAGEWPALLRRLLAGEEPVAAVGAAFPGRFESEPSRELWWQTGWHHLRRTQGLPMLSAVDSRAVVAGLARFVASTEGEVDVVVSLREVLAQSGEVWLDLERQRRITEVNRVVPALHPFYRNAALSLAAALAWKGTSAEAEALCRRFDQDWADALEIDAATQAALNELERQLAQGPLR